MSLSSWAKASLVWVMLGLASAPPANAGVIDGGAKHACALDAQGAVWCWGDNSYGQLGIGTANEAFAFPIRISPMAFENQKLVSVSTGSYHSCALDSEGKAWCWGINYAGQLGIGNESTHAAPQKVSMESVLPSHRFVSISAGYSHTCAIDADGKGYCWGSDGDGELGNDASILDKDVPTAVAMPPGAKFTALRAGDDFTCALDTSQAWCWGSNTSSQLGVGSNISGSTTPLAVSLPAGVQLRSIALGAYHTCAIDLSGGAWCWGRSIEGQLGNPASAGSYVPSAVDRDSLPLGTQFTQISTGSYHTCALDASGEVWCWGSNSQGQIGNDGPHLDHELPTQVALSAEFGKAEAIGAGDSFNCVINRGGSVSCWGEGTDGQLGTGSFGFATQPQAVAIPAVTQVATGVNHSCALDWRGGAWCWGADSLGQLGNGDPRHDSATPAPISTANLPVGWQFVAIAAGYSHTCALDASGAAWCWGFNALGQLGLGFASTYPHAVTAPSPVGMAGVPGGFTQITAGANHTCALDTTGKIWCWGYDFMGQLGDGDEHENRYLPTLVDVPGKTFKQVSAGSYFTCAIEASAGTLYCWGSNSDGQLGFNDTNQRSTPEPLPFLGNFDYVAVAAGAAHACAARAISGNPSESRLYCWGSNSYYAVGNGATQSEVLTPIDTGINVIGGSDASVAVKLALGYGHSCAGSAFFGYSMCWGKNELGQLGDGTRIHRSAAVLSQLGQVRQLAAGYYHTCAIRTDDTLVCVGDDSYGQLGDGVMGNALVPVTIPNFVAWSSGVFSDDFEGAQ